MILALLFHSFLITCVEVIVVINIVKPFLKGDVMSILEITQGGWGADFATRFGGTKVQQIRFPGFLFCLFVFFIHREQQSNQQCHSLSLSGKPMRCATLTLRQT